MSKDFLMGDPIFNVNTNTELVSTQLTVFSFPECCRYGVQQEEQKIQQKLVNWQAMQISYTTVL
jgi:hypothetical protein